MSWLTDIAGKAEDFLNKVDQKAASTLHKGSSPHKKRKTPSSTYLNLESAEDSREGFISDSSATSRSCSPPRRFNYDDNASTTSNNEFLRLGNIMTDSFGSDGSLETNIQVEDRIDTSCDATPTLTTARSLPATQDDLKASLGAKDSQLAVLRIRLQEADSKIDIRSKKLDDLKAENERLTRELQHSTEMMQSKINHLEKELDSERHKRTLIEQESFQRHLSLQEEVRQITEALSASQREVSSLKVHQREASTQVQQYKQQMERSYAELTDYKRKAQSILQSKEKLIASLRESMQNSGNGTILQDGSAMATQVNAAALESAQQEIGLLREQLEQAQAALQNAHDEISRAEDAFERDREHLRERQEAVLGELQEERLLRHDAQQDIQRLRHELQVLQDEGSQQVSLLQQRLVERDAENEKLRKQLMVKSNCAMSDSELEARLRTLTESLIQKQTLVEALQTERNALQLQLQRTESHLKEAETAAQRGQRNHTIVSGISGGDGGNSLRNRIPGIFVESPFDGSVTRRVKRVYSTLDTFSIRLGAFMRRYPISRVLVILYMFLLHLWVTFVLLTYEPEIHGPEMLMGSGSSRTHSAAKVSLPLK